MKRVMYLLYEIHDVAPLTYLSLCQSEGNCARLALSSVYPGNIGIRDNTMKRLR